MTKKKSYPDGDLEAALAILNSPRGSMTKAAHFLDCSPGTAKTKLLEYQNKQLKARESSGRKVIPIHKSSQKQA